MEIVILDGYTLNPGDLSWEEFEKLGTVRYYDRTTDTDAAERIGNADVVITNKTPVTKETLETCSNIKYIGVLATGYNVVDVKTASKKGIPVCNIPTYGTTSVAQFAFAHILNICHRVQDHSNSVKRGDWSNKPDFCYWLFPPTELAGKIMGIVGYGKIGQAVGKLAKAFGMTVYAYDVYKNEALEDELMRYVSLDELYASSDVISLHCPLFESTEEMINAESLAKMKNHVILINTARGPLIVEQDLADALNAGKIRAAGLDVASTEPIDKDNVLLTAKNCFITPHIAWAPLEARSRLMDIAVDNLSSFIKGEIKNKVN